MTHKTVRWNAPLSHRNFYHFEQMNVFLFPNVGTITAPFTQNVSLILSQISPEVYQVPFPVFISIRIKCVFSSERLNHYFSIHGRPVDVLYDVTEFSLNGSTEMFFFFSLSLFWRVRWNSSCGSPERALVIEFLSFCHSPVGLARPWGSKASRYFVCDSMLL